MPFLAFSGLSLDFCQGRSAKLYKKRLSRGTLRGCPSLGAPTILTVALVNQETNRGAAVTTDASGETSLEEPTPRQRGNDGRYLPGPRRPRGAPRGNVSAVRNPWNTYWRRRALRHCDRWVLRLLDDYVPNLVADKGGEDNVSFAEHKVMEIAAVACACRALAMSYQSYTDVARFLVIEMKALSDLGLKRRAKLIDPIQVAREAVAQASRTGEPLDAPS